MPVRDRPRGTRSGDVSVGLESAIFARRIATSRNERGRPGRLMCGAYGFAILPITFRPLPARSCAGDRFRHSPASDMEDWFLATPAHDSISGALQGPLPASILLRIMMERCSIRLLCRPLRLAGFAASAAGDTSSWGRPSLMQWEIQKISRHFGEFCSRRRTAPSKSGRMPEAMIPAVYKQGISTGGARKQTSHHIGRARLSTTSVYFNKGERSSLLNNGTARSVRSRTSTLAIPTAASC